MAIDTESMVKYCKQGVTTSPIANSQLDDDYSCVATRFEFEIFLNLCSEFVWTIPLVIITSVECLPAAVATFFGAPCFSTWLHEHYVIAFT